MILVYSIIGEFAAGVVRAAEEAAVGTVALDEGAAAARAAAVGYGLLAVVGCAFDACVVL